MPPLCLISKSAAGTPFTRHTSSLGYWVVPTVFTSASSRTLEAAVGASTGTHTDLSAAACFRAPESTMTFTPVHGPSEALGEAAAEEDAGVEAVGWVVAGAEHAARLNRRPAAARELGAAVRILVKVTCQE
ncbi:hypothetical protein ARTHRO9AX_220027 [Arthrobacter sp. 9AX]|nr:hypothetical protein ARTHRO9AX_220027 [Arthrobacter sp. 9AX]